MRELLSVIVPCYNEGAVIERTAKAIVDTCTGRAFDFEIIFVNDGSKDTTWEEIVNASANNKNTCRKVRKNKIHFF